MQVLGGPVERGDEILTEEALAFVAGLHAPFGARRDELLARRKQRRAEAARTGRLDFLPETKHIREGDWQVAEPPADLADRRVEITGPTDRKMTINALNSGAKVWLADLEDANTPHWHNVVAGQVNLYDAVRQQLELHHRRRARRTRCATTSSTPSPWCARAAGTSTSGTSWSTASRWSARCVDFGLYFFHNAEELLGRGSGPYFYLPKMESHLEARLWNDVFTHAQDELGIPHGTIRATVLIETIPAAFEMEEILYELRDHASGLNAGPLGLPVQRHQELPRRRTKFVLPDRNAVTMTAPFMRAYTELLVRTCHRRGAFAIGGMAAFIPSRRTRRSTRRRWPRCARTRSARPATASTARGWPTPTWCRSAARSSTRCSATSPTSSTALREDVQVDRRRAARRRRDPGRGDHRGRCAAPSTSALRYIAAWLGGNGAAAIHNLMEDAATAEISRSQIWQWVHNDVVLASGEQVTADLVREVLADTEKQLRAEEGFPVEHLSQAVELFEQVALADEFVDFLTLPAYEQID